METRVKLLIEDVVYGMNVPIIKSVQGKLPDEPTEPDVPIQPDDPDIPLVPKYLYMGTLDMQTLGINRMQDITAEHIKTHLTKHSDGVYEKEDIQTDKYDIITIAVLQNRTVYVDDGLGGKIKFSTNYPDIDGNIFCANGEITCQIDGDIYAIYGVLTSIAGTNYIYVE